MCDIIFLYFFIKNINLNFLNTFNAISKEFSLYLFFKQGSPPKNKQHKPIYDNIYISSPSKCIHKFCISILVIWLINSNRNIYILRL